MKTELKSKCCGADVQAFQVNPVGWECFRCGKACELQANPPQEPQSETPRTDVADRQSPITQGSFGSYNHILSFARTLERELNEFITAEPKKIAERNEWRDKLYTAEHELNEANKNNGKWLGYLCQLCGILELPLNTDGEGLIAGVKKLQQELSQVRGELGRAKELLVAERLSAGELAKQNHKMREALKAFRSVIDWEHCKAKLDGDAVRDLKEADGHAEEVINTCDTTSLVVLSRAEVESMTCKCFDRSGNSSNDVGIIKCTKHILLERFTK